jgi:hypothetical protein
MSGALAMLASVGGRFSAALTIGNSGGFYGYFLSSYGSITSTVFGTKTVDRIIWDNTASGTVILSLHGTSVANSDSTFVALIVDGHLLTRASATYTANDGSGRTQWAWSVDTSGYPTSGTKAVSAS